MLTAGQRHAAKEAVKRRGELDMTQAEVAEAADISLATLQNFENGRSWPQPRTLAKLERLGLGWAHGHIADLVEEYNNRTTQSSQALIDAVLRSDLSPGVKATISDRLRTEQLTRADELERRAAAHQSPGEELEGGRRPA